MIDKTAETKTQELVNTANALVADDMGLLAMDQVNLSAAQQALLHRAKCNQAARRGKYTTAMKRP